MFIRSIDRRFQPVNLAPDDAKRHFTRSKIIARGRDIGAQIEQVILDTPQTGNKRNITISAFKRGNRDAQRAVRFIHLANSMHSRIGL